MQMEKFVAEREVVHLHLVSETSHTLPKLKVSQSTVILKIKHQITTVANRTTLY